MLNLLQTLQQADSAFPSGSFAFSNGLEGLASLGARLDGAGLTGLFAAILRHRWAPCDRVAVAQAWRAGARHGDLGRIDREVEAATFPQSLREGSCRNGAALLVAHARLQTPGAAELRLAVAGGTLLGHLAVLQGALWRGAGLDEDAAVQVSGYTALSGLAAAAVRLGCLGALAAQAALRDSLPLLAALAATPVREGEPLGGALPWLDIACAHQSDAPLRLFAN